MTKPEHVIPWDRLPPGFAQQIDAPPPAPAEARPASTVVLVRAANAGPEVLLLRRHGRAGFVPGAWVFPGGRVDPGDALDGYWTGPANRPATPDPAYWVAAVREVFEETGVLLARAPSGREADAGAERRLAWREALLTDRITLLDVLEDGGMGLDLEEVLHLAHWITPRVEPRRYDTHFFLAALPPGQIVAPDEREMTGAQWLRPRAALEHHGDGSLPMVFPTVRVLGELAAFDDVDAMFATLRGRRVRTIMPELVRTPEGLGFVVDVEGRE